VRIFYFKHHEFRKQECGCSRLDKLWEEKQPTPCQQHEIGILERRGSH